MTNEIQTYETNEIDTMGASNKLKQMFAFIKDNLVKGTDYMSIAGGKPTLLKQGAEKMNILVGYYPEYEILKEFVDTPNNVYDVTVKCTLRSRKDNSKVAEGIASCNSKEPAKVKEAASRGMDMYGQKNSILKIAEKRAYVGATLNANALSQFYTQDLEDEIQEDPRPVTLACDKCHKEISRKVADYSAQKWGVMLCMDCQKTTG